MNISEISEKYRAKSDDELLRLAVSPDQLTDEARTALQVELATRNLDDNEHLAAARNQEKARKADIGNLMFVPHFGVGRMRFGRAGRTFDPITLRERFSTTVFIVLLCFPFVPTGTYLVERQPEFPDHLTSLERLPLDWQQVLKVWIVTIGSILACIFLLRLLT
jgi:hypothetical protein